VRHAEVDQARLLATGDDLDGMAERLLRLLEEARRIPGLAQGIGADRAHAAARHVAQALAEACQALERPFGGLPAEVVVIVEATAQAHHFLEPVENLGLAILQAHDDHVETVRSEVDGGEQGAVVGHEKCLAVLLRGL